MGEAEELLASLNEYYGSSYQPDGKLILRKDRLFLYSGLETQLQYVWIGLHIGNGDLSWTIEGAQKLGTTATKNILTITMAQATQYYQGEDLTGYKGDGHVILKTSDRIIGPGLNQNRKIINTLPKSRKTKK